MPNDKVNGRRYSGVFLTIEPVDIIVDIICYVRVHLGM